MGDVPHRGPPGWAIALFLTGCASCEGPIRDSGVVPTETSTTTTGTGRDGLTWHRHVRPLIYFHCGGCHGPDGVASDSPLRTYDEVVARLDAVISDSSSGRMPPDLSGATADCEPSQPTMSNRLDDETLALLVAWAESGAEEGDPAWAGILIPPTSTSLPFFSRDLQATAPVELPPGEGEWCFAFDPQITTRHFVTGVEVVPSNPSVVYEAVVYIDSDFDNSFPDDGAPAPCDGWLLGQELAVWHPGDGGTLAESDSAWKLEPAGRVLLQVHYRVLGAETALDSPGVHLLWSEEVAEEVVDGTRVGTDASAVAAEGLLPDDDDISEFRVPAGAMDHQEAYVYTVSDTKDQAIFAVWPAMNAAGVSFELWVDHLEPREGEPASECVLALPDWSTRLSRPYRFDTTTNAAPMMRTGDVVRARCTYDNASANVELTTLLAEEGVVGPIDLVNNRFLPSERCTALLQAINVTGEQGWPEPIVEPTGTEPTVPDPGQPEFLLTEVLDHREVGVVKYVEITNVGTASARLDDWTLHRWANGSAIPEVVALDPVTIGAEASAIVAATDGVIDLIDLFGVIPDADSPFVSGNGDDAYGLVDPMGVVVDVFGVPGVDGTGAEWEYRDSVATRVGGVASGTWDAASWIILAGSATATPGAYLPDSVPTLAVVQPEDVQTGLIPLSTEVIVSGLVVSAIADDGLYAQTESGGPWSGLWVYLGAHFSDTLGVISPGDQIDIRGVTDEYASITEVDVVGAPHGTLSVIGTQERPIGTVPIATVLAEAETWESVWVFAEDIVARTDSDAEGRFSVDVEGGLLLGVAPNLWTYPPVTAGQGFAILAGPLTETDGLWTVLPTRSGDFVPW